MSTQGLHKVRIHIDEDKVRLPEGRHAVAELKHLVDPPISADHVLFVDVDGGPDLELQQDGEVDVVEGLVLYSRGPDGAHPKKTPIVIDGVRVSSDTVSVTGAIIRRLVDPPIGDDRDIFRDIDGAPDERIDDNEEVTLTKGAEFYSVPRVIAPGAPA